MQTPRNNQDDQSVLALLRHLVPRRRVTFIETLRIAELQANRLREHLGIDEPEASSEIITELPRIAVVIDSDLPVSGSAHWDGTRWVITLNGADARLRRRFSLMHEFKHVVDHTTKGLLYGIGMGTGANDRAERAADYFAACLLMPKRYVKRLWGEGLQRPQQLAPRFDVSVPAMRYRLDQLGLTDRRRCRADGFDRMTRYLRQGHPPTMEAA